MKISSYPGIQKPSRGQILWRTLFLSVCVLPILAQSQDVRKPPVLIRDTDTAEGMENQEEPGPREPNPMLAEENLEIGDFYYKRKNYKAAIQRYIEALEYQPNLIKAFEALAKAYEKNDEFDKAINTYRDFLDKYPDSPKASDFRDRLSELEKKSH